ncbi:carboxypeptidase regulatory-like domain-containing protein [Rhodopirellula bahusiensis]|uniref:carboxypeptidase regulatory-like domain-containing protein n=1 Tax=Rhodopirellula bahusiensis TaxID=2014065 RepID=UPI0032650181
MSLLLRSAIGLGLLLTLGCEPQPSSTLGQVTGTVLHDGVPVPNMALEFHPVSGGRPSLAFTNDSGQFEAIYLANVPGAKIGTHDIRYELTPGKLASDISPAEMLTMERPMIANGAILDLTRVTVKQGSNHFEFKLIPPPDGEIPHLEAGYEASVPPADQDPPAVSDEPEVMLFVQPVEEETPMIDVIPE